MFKEHLDGTQSKLLMRLVNRLGTKYVDVPAKACVFEWQKRMVKNR